LVALHVLDWYVVVVVVVEGDIPVFVVVVSTACFLA
jgi:hypothetical protein